MVKVSKYRSWTAQDPNVVMQERYLGLHSPGDDGVPPDVIANLASMINAHLDLDAIVQVSDGC